MTDQTIKAAPLVGDAMSQLVQVIVRDVKLKDFKPTGKGDQDVRQIVLRAFNSDLGRHEVWQCISDLLKLIDATPDLPESFKGTVAAGVLRARACVDLGAKT